MRNVFAYVLIGVLSMSTVSAQQMDRLHIKLHAFDFDRVLASKKYFEKRMAKTRAVLLGSAAVLAGSVAGYYGYKKYQETTVQTSDIDSKIHAINATGGSDAEKLVKMNLLASERKARSFDSNHHQPGGLLERVIERPLKMTLWVGFGLTLLASGHQIFRVFSGTMEDALQLLWHGYECWYVKYEDQVRTLMAQLREAFYEARKMAQQSSVEQQLLLARQQRRAQLSAMNAHDRSGIVMRYQELVATLERVVALMLIILPEENHPLVNQHVSVIQTQLNAVGESLECDLNENTHGMLTHYSNNTLDSYHECVESIGIFLSTYRTYLPQ